MENKYNRVVCYVSVLCSSVVLVRFFLTISIDPLIAANLDFLLNADQLGWLGCPIPALFLILPMGFLAKCSKLLKKNSHVFFFFLTFRGRCLKKTPQKAFFSIFLIFSPWSFNFQITGLGYVISCILNYMWSKNYQFLTKFRGRCLKKKF
jgi:hypothetical protein